MTTIEALRAIRALIDTPEKWTQGAFARRADGVKVTHDSSEAVCFCLEGARIRAAKGAERSTITAFDDEFPCLSWAAWNDAPGRTHAEVLARVDSMIAREKGRTK